MKQTLLGQWKRLVPISTSLQHTTSNNFSKALARSFSTINIPDAKEIFDYGEDVGNMSNEALMNVETIPGFTTLIHSMPKKESTPRNALVGKVVSDKMQKTVNVAVDRYRIIPKYRKRKKFTKKFFCHDENEICSNGDLVMIVPCQRISRHKHFRVHEIIRRKGMFNDE